MLRSVAPHRASRAAAARVLLALSLIGCGGGGDGGSGGITTPPPPPPPPPPPDGLLATGERLFDLETFGGNGRTCVTCHMRETGTITLEAIAARVLTPSDPLFRHDGLDGGLDGTTRIAREGTIRVELTLPSYVTLADNPAQRTIVVNRGVPSTVNMPALDGTPFPAIMLDLRNDNLQDQARDAITGHAKGTVAPSADQLSAIAAFEQQGDRFFSSAALRVSAGGGARVDLPQGTTQSEQDGRLFFLETGAPGTKQGMCGECHGGPNLNEVTLLGNRETLQPAGAKFSNAGISERNVPLNPLFTFRVDNGSGDVRVVTSPDPGIMLTPRQTSRHLNNFLVAGVHPALTANLFKIPSLWGIKRTPPYFHDNSAKTLRDVVDHYADHLFKQNPFAGVFNTLTEQERIDVVAYLNLL